MYVNKAANVSLNSSNSSSDVVVREAEQSLIFDFSAQDDKVDDGLNITGSNANVNLSLEKNNSILPGFEQRELVINTNNGKSFTIKLHISQDIAPEMLQTILPKFASSFANSKTSEFL